MPVGGIYTRNDYTVDQLDFRLTGQYNKVWNDTHIMNLFAGMEANKTDKEQIFHSDYGVDYDNARLVTITPEFYKQANEEGTVLSSFSKAWTRSLAYFFSGSYSYKGRYTLNYTMRYEGTNKLGKSRSSRWLPTWNVSGAWNAHEEKFFQKLMENTNYAISHLTMRASYSLTADRGPTWISNALPMYYSINVWRPQGDQRETALYLDNIGNSDLTYEKKHEFNLGIDAGFLNNRLNFNFDIYWRNNYDLIGYIETQGADGFINKMGNVATMKEIASILKTLNVKMTYAEENSMGAIDIELIKKDWKKVTSFQTSNTSKRDIVENVIVMFEQGEGTLFDTQEVRTQFSSFIQDKTKGGKITYHNVRDDIHDDYVISYCLAQWARKQYETRGKYNIA